MFCICTAAAKIFEEGQTGYNSNLLQLLHEGTFYKKMSETEAMP